MISLTIYGPTQPNK